MGVVIDGQACAAGIRQRIVEDVAALRGRGVTPTLATLLVGEDAGARIYRRQLERAAGDLGIDHRASDLGADTTVTDIVDAVRSLVLDPAVHAILPLRPFPAGIPEGPVLDALDPRKDADGLHPVNVGRLVLGTPTVVPATALACFEILEWHLRNQGLEPADAIAGRDLVIAGRSQSVGRPVYALALQRNATATTVHSFTSKAGRFAEHTRRADILIVAMGRPAFITSDMVKPGAVVIDVGINSVPALDSAGRPILDDRGRPKRKTVGDVAFEDVLPVAGAITPVPGGVGAVTNLLLMRSVLRAAEL
jgi:methylenetetrahydrofolate dehydrogenase (NADP+) / methenyltetrahydrofolate cyclohydrolase